MQYYLKHHGIEGQKWGKRNGPPYPLDAEDHSAAEKKANNFSKTGKIIDKKSPNIQQNKKEEKKKISKKEIDIHRQKMIKKMANNPSQKKLYENATDEQIAKDIENRKKLKDISTAIIAGSVAFGLTVGVAYAIRKHNIESVAAVFNNKADTLDSIMNNNQTITLDTANEIMHVRTQNSGMTNGLLDVTSTAKIHEAAMRDMDVVFEEGSTFARVSFSKDFDLNKARDVIFADPSYKDHQMYYNMLGNFDGGTTKNSVKIKNTDQIKTPGFDKTRQILSELYKDPDFKNDVAQNLADLMAKNYNSRNIFKIDKNDPQLQKAVKDMMNNGKDAYNIILAMGGENSSLNSKISKEFIDRGYHAVWDLHDIEDNFTDIPIILLDKSRLKVDRIDKRPS